MRVLSLDELVRWGHPLAPKPQTIVVLGDGGRIVTAADWAGGAAVRLGPDEIVLLSDTWDEVHVPRWLVRGIVFSQQSRADERERLAEVVRNEPSPNPSLQGRRNAEADVVLLSNGDRLSGKLTELDRGSLAIETRSGVAKLPLSRVEAIGFADSHQPSAVGHRPEDGGKLSKPSRHTEKEIVIGVRDGSLLFVKSIRADGKGAEIELAEGVKLKGGTVDDIVAIQSPGERIVYLSDLEPASYRHVPYLSVAWPLMRDRNVLGRPIEVLGKRYLKGIGMHSAARLTYQLDREYRGFDSAVAIDDSAKGRGSVAFGAYVLRDGKWTEAYTSPVVRGGEAPVPVSIDLRGAKGLTLTVDFADWGDEMDRAVWVDARLVR